MLAQRFLETHTRRESLWQPRRSVPVSAWRQARRPPTAFVAGGRPVELLLHCVHEKNHGVSKREITEPEKLRRRTIGIMNDRASHSSEHHTYRLMLVPFQRFLQKAPSHFERRVLGRRLHRLDRARHGLQNLLAHPDLRGAVLRRQPLARQCGGTTR